MDIEAYESGVYPALECLDDEDTFASSPPPSAPIVAPEANGPAEEDAAIVAALLRDEPRAWREFNVRYDALIRACVAKVTRRFGARVTADDEREIRSLLVLSLLGNEKRKLRSFDPARGARLSTWLGLLATNAAYDYLRLLRREPAKAPLAEAFEVPADGEDPFEVAATREQATIASRMLADLSERDRHFATLYLSGIAPPEIARQMNISIQTVYSKRHKIQSRLESLTPRTAA